jgi:hypothetical protein
MLTQTPTELYPDLFTGLNPAAIVFDCDYTLYPYDCDKDYLSPFTMTPSGLIDYYGRLCNPFPDISHMVGAIVDAGIPVAFLSRNPSAGPLENLLHTIPVYSKKGVKTLWEAMPSRDYFHAYSTGGFGKGKDKHFAALKALTGITQEQVIFFDDMPDNIQAATTKGATAILVGKSGATWDALNAGITSWRAKQAAPTKIEGGAARAE